MVYFSEKFDYFVPLLLLVCHDRQGFLPAKISTNSYVFAKILVERAFPGFSLFAQTKKAQS
jgi:hypothetical protein